MSELRAPFYVRTVRPHVWAVLMRDAANLDPNVTPDSDRDAVVQWFGARECGGDALAREAARGFAKTMCQRQAANNITCASATGL